MSDRLFFPIILAVAAVMVYLALQPDADCAPTGPVGGADTDYSEVRVEQCNLRRIIAGSSADIELIGDEGQRYLSIESGSGPLQDGPEFGPHFRLASDLETQFAGFTVRVTIRARPAPDRGAMAFEANYSAGKAGQSGWKSFDLQPDWQDYVFEVRVPRASGQGVDYLGIRPIVPDKTRRIEIKSISFRRLARWDNGDGA